MRRARGLVGTMLAALFVVGSQTDTALADEPPIFCGTEGWQPFIQEAADRTGVPETWIHAVMHAESGGCTFQNGKPVRSAAGAMGLMQLMPATWSQVRERLQLGVDPYDPHDNILAGAETLRELFESYGFPGFLVAYHAGGKRFEEYEQRGVPLPERTLEYVARVQRLVGAGHGKGAQLQPEFPAIHTPFVQSTRATSLSTSPSDQPPHNRLFVPRMHAARAPEQQTPQQTDVQRR
jgi:Transglycosylase SLT domain